MGSRRVGEHLVEGLALDALHRDEVHRLAFAEGSAVDVVDRDDVGVVQRRGGLGLALETPPALGVADGFAGEELQGDRALEPRVERAIDDSHPALAKLAEDPVMGDRLFGHGHRK